MAISPGELYVARVHIVVERSYRWCDHRSTSWSNAVTLIPEEAVYMSDTPMAHDAREEASPLREESAKELFPYRSMSVEEYAARHGADWGCFSFDEYRYADESLDRWIAALGRLFSTPGRLSECQEKWLSPDELARARARADEEF
jgi:hypothetical protein